MVRAATTSLFAFEQRNEGRWFGENCLLLSPVPSPLVSYFSNTPSRVTTGCLLPRPTVTHEIVYSIASFPHSRGHRLLSFLAVSATFGSPGYVQSAAPARQVARGATTPRVPTAAQVNRTPATPA